MMDTSCLHKDQAWRVQIHSHQQQQPSLVATSIIITIIATAEVKAAATTTISNINNYWYKPK